MCEDLRENFSKRFQDLNGRKTQMNLFQRPFSVDVEYIDDADTQLELLDLRLNQVLHDVFQQNSLFLFKEFHSRLEDKYPVFLRNAKIWICQFASTYSCEQAFSIMKINKSQLRTRLRDEHLDSVMRIAIYPLKPNISNLVHRKRLQSISFSGH